MKFPLAGMMGVVSYLSHEAIIFLLTQQFNDGKFAVFVKLLNLWLRRAVDQGPTAVGVTDGMPWIGNNPQDHPGMIQVFLGHIGALDIVGNELPCLVYVSREKRPGFQHHKRAGAMNALSIQEKTLEGSTSSESEWTSFIQSGSEFLEFVNKHIQLEMRDEDQIEENRSEYIELLRQMFKLAGYIRRMSHQSTTIRWRKKPQHSK
ncbi:hypothetical protein SUGI_0076190 [Cryptomeria japonica]|nr:hypothetical protein SUGI_0076190 [Cryptomeria japonica]